MEPCYPTMIGSVLVDDAPRRSVARTVIRYVPASRPAAAVRSPAQESLIRT
jgi:hypothetical protein